MSAILVLCSESLFLCLLPTSSIRFRIQGIWPYVEVIDWCRGKFCTVINRDLFSFFCMPHHLTSTICCRCYLSPECRFSLFKKQNKTKVFISGWTYVCIFNLILLISDCCYPIPCCFYYSSSAIQIEIEDDNATPAVFLLFRCVLALLDFLCLCMKFRIIFPFLWRIMLEFW